MGAITLQFVTSRDPESWAIRTFQRGWCSHVDSVIDDGRLLGARSDGGVQIRQPNDETFSRVEPLPETSPATGARLSCSILGEGYTQGDLETFRSYWMNDIERQGKVPITAIGGSGRSDEKSKRGVEVHGLYPEGDNGMFLEYRRFPIRTLAASFGTNEQSTN
jgi:hypothetical protein